MNEMQLTPIGTSPAWYNAGEACSGYLVTVRGSRILLDCGSGVVSRYLAWFGEDEPIDAIVLTHVHADHCSDLVPLKYGIELGTLGSWRPQLWLPPGARDRLATYVSAWDQPPTFFDSCFDVRDIEPGVPADVCGTTLRTVEVPHYIESVALRVDGAEASLGYTGDTGPAAHLPDFFSGVDLLVAEAAHPPDAPLDVPGRGHISAVEAGEIAQAAGAHSLLITHVPEQHGIERAVALAADRFTRGPVEHAHAGSRYDVARRLAAAS